MQFKLVNANLNGPTGRVNASEQQLITFDNIHGQTPVKGLSMIKEKKTRRGRRGSVSSQKFLQRFNGAPSAAPRTEVDIVDLCRGLELNTISELKYTLKTLQILQKYGLGIKTVFKQENKPDMEITYDTVWDDSDFENDENNNKNKLIRKGFRGVKSKLRRIEARTKRALSQPPIQREPKLNSYLDRAARAKFYKSLYGDNSENKRNKLIQYKAKRTLQEQERRASLTRAYEIKRVRHRIKTAEQKRLKGLSGFGPNSNYKRELIKTVKPKEKRFDDPKNGGLYLLDILNYEDTKKFMAYVRVSKGVHISTIKKQLSHIAKPENMELFYDTIKLENNKQLKDYGIIGNDKLFLKVIKLLSYNEFKQINDATEQFTTQENDQGPNDPVFKITKFGTYFTDVLDNGASCIWDITSYIAIDIELQTQCENCTSLTNLCKNHYFGIIYNILDKFGLDVLEICNLTYTSDGCSYEKTTTMTLNKATYIISPGRPTMLNNGTRDQKGNGPCDFPKYVERKKLTDWEKLVLQRVNEKSLNTVPSGYAEVILNAYLNELRAISPLQTKSNECNKIIRELISIGQSPFKGSKCALCKNNYCAEYSKCNSGLCEEIKNFIINGGIVCLRSPACSCEWCIKLKQNDYERRRDTLMYERNCSILKMEPTGIMLKCDYCEQEMGSTKHCSKCFDYMSDLQRRLNKITGKPEKIPKDINERCYNCDEIIGTNTQHCWVCEKFIYERMDEIEYDSGMEEPIREIGEHPDYTYDQKMKSKDEYRKPTHCLMARTKHVCRRVDHYHFGDETESDDELFTNNACPYCVGTNTQCKHTIIDFDKYTSIYGSNGFNRDIFKRAKQPNCPICHDRCCNHTNKEKAKRRKLEIDAVGILEQSKKNKRPKITTLRGVYQFPAKQIVNKSETTTSADQCIRKEAEQGPTENQRKRRRSYKKKAMGNSARNAGIGYPRLNKRVVNLEKQILNTIKRKPWGSTQRVNTNVPKKPRLNYKMKPKVGNKIRPNNSKGVVITHRELMASVSTVLGPGSTQTLNTTAYTINPGRNQLTNWLSNMANTFDQYRLIAMKFVYKGNTGNFKDGKVYFSIIYDPTDTELAYYSTEKALLGNPSHSWCYINGRMTCRYQKIHFRGSPILYVRNGNPTDNPNELRWYDLGTLVVGAISSQAIASCGNVEIHYKFKFMNPRSYITYLSTTMAGIPDSNQHLMTGTFGEYSTNPPGEAQIGTTNDRYYFTCNYTGVLIFRTTRNSGSGQQYTLTIVPDTQSTLTLYQFIEDTTYNLLIYYVAAVAESYINFVFNTSTGSVQSAELSLSGNSVNIADPNLEPFSLGLSEYRPSRIRGQRGYRVIMPESDNETKYSECDDDDDDDPHGMDLNPSGEPSLDSKCDFVPALHKSSDVETAKDQMAKKENEQGPNNKLIVFTTKLLEFVVCIIFATLIITNILIHVYLKLICKYIFTNQQVSVQTEQQQFIMGQNYYTLLHWKLIKRKMSLLDKLNGTRILEATALMAKKQAEQGPYHFIIYLLFSRVMGQIYPIPPPTTLAPTYTPQPTYQSATTMKNSLLSMVGAVGSGIADLYRYYYLDSNDDINTQLIEPDYNGFVLKSDGPITIRITYMSVLMYFSDLSPVITFYVLNGTCSNLNPYQVWTSIIEEEWIQTVIWHAWCDNGTLLLPELNQQSFFVDRGFSTEIEASAVMTTHETFYSRAYPYCFNRRVMQVKPSTAKPTSNQPTLIPTTMQPTHNPTTHPPTTGSPTPAPTPTCFFTNQRTIYFTVNVVSGNIVYSYTQGGISLNILGGELTYEFPDIPLPNATSFFMYLRCDTPDGCGATIDSKLLFERSGGGGHRLWFGQALDATNIVFTGTGTAMFTLIPLDVTGFLIYSSLIEVEDVSNDCSGICLDCDPDIIPVAVVGSIPGAAGTKRNAKGDGPITYLFECRTEINKWKTQGLIKFEDTCFQCGKHDKRCCGMLVRYLKCLECKCELGLGVDFQFQQCSNCVMFNRLLDKYNGDNGIDVDHSEPKTTINVTQPKSKKKSDKKKLKYKRCDKCGFEKEELGCKYCNWRDKFSVKPKCIQCGHYVGISQLRCNDCFKGVKKPKPEIQEIEHASQQRNKKRCNVKSINNIYSQSKSAEQKRQRKRNKGLTNIPYRKLQYKGKSVADFDLYPSTNILECYNKNLTVDEVIKRNLKQKARLNHHKRNKKAKQTLDAMKSKHTKGTTKKHVKNVDGSYSKVPTHNMTFNYIYTPFVSISGKCPNVKKRQDLLLTEKFEDYVGDNHYVHTFDHNHSEYMPEVIITDHGIQQRIISTQFLFDNIVLECVGDNLYLIMTKIVEKDGSIVTVESKPYLPNYPVTRGPTCCRCGFVAKGKCYKMNARTLCEHCTVLTYKEEKQFYRTFSKFTVNVENDIFDADLYNETKKAFEFTGRKLPVIRKGLMKANQYFNSDLAKPKKHINSLINKTKLRLIKRLVTDLEGEYSIINHFVRSAPMFTYCNQLELMAQGLIVETIIDYCIKQLFNVYLVYVIQQLLLAGSLFLPQLVTATGNWDGLKDRRISSEYNNMLVVIQTILKLNSPSLLQLRYSDYKHWLVSNEGMKAMNGNIIIMLKLMSQASFILLIMTGYFLAIRTLIYNTRSPKIPKVLVLLLIFLIIVMSDDMINFGFLLEVAIKLFNVAFSLYVAYEICNLMDDAVISNWLKQYLLKMVAVCTLGSACYFVTLIYITLMMVYYSHLLKIKMLTYYWFDGKLIFLGRQGAQLVNAVLLCGGPITAILQILGLFLSSKVERTLTKLSSKNKQYIPTDAIPLLTLMIIQPVPYLIGKVADGTGVSHFEKHMLDGNIMIEQLFNQTLQKAICLVCDELVNINDIEIINDPLEVCNTRYHRAMVKQKYPDSRISGEHGKICYGQTTKGIYYWLTHPYVKQHSFSNCSFNEEAAMRMRFMCKVQPKKAETWSNLEPFIDDAIERLSRRLTRKHKLKLYKTIWLKRYGPKLSKKMMDEYESNGDVVNMKFKINTKFESTVKYNEAIELEEKKPKPRGVFPKSNQQLMDTGPYYWGLKKLMCKELNGLGYPVLCGAGLNPKQLGYKLAKALEKFNLERLGAVEADLARCEANIRGPSLQIEKIVMEKLKMPQHLINQMYNQESISGMSVSGGRRYKLPLVRTSGTANTFTGNTICYTVKLLAAANYMQLNINDYLILISGDDCVFYFDNTNITMDEVKTLFYLVRDLGFEPEIVECRHFLDARFYSGRFLPVQNEQGNLTLRHYPLPFRALVKNFSTKTHSTINPLEIAWDTTHARDLVEYQGCPILEPLNAQFKTMLQPFAKKVKHPELNYMWHNYEFPSIKEQWSSTLDTYLTLANTYDCSIFDIIEIEEMKMQFGKELQIENTFIQMDLK